MTTTLDEEVEGLAPDAEEEAQTPLAALEEKYAAQMRQIFPVKIDLPMLTLRTQIDEQINLRPEFQRRDRWTDRKRSRFIESIVMNVPVPPVFLGEEEYGKYVVLDGRQRLTAVYRFLKDELALEHLAIWKELNGLTYSGLKTKGFASSIERRFLPAVLLTRESSPEVKYEVFDRLNTGGVEANQMEVRNAVFQGKFTQALHKLSEDGTFRALWGIPTKEAELERSRLYSTMADLELVLRFFALKDGTLNGLRFKDHLTDFMKIRNAEYSAHPELEVDDADLFRQTVETCRTIFGVDAFRPPTQKDASRPRLRSAPYADAIMQASAEVDAKTLTTRRIALIKEAIEKLSGEGAFLDAISKGTNGEGAVKARINAARAVVQAVQRQGD